MRRKDREVTQISKVSAVMDACECCRIGLVDNNEAYIVPMNFGCEIVEDEITLFFHCAKEGRKIDLIPEQKMVSFEMDTKHSLVEGHTGCDFSFLYQCVMGKGKLEIVENDDENVYGLKKIMQHYTAKDNWVFDPKVLDMLHVLKLSVAEWSCKEH